MSYMNYGIKPDIVSMAKGLGGGMPIGAICATEEVSKAFTAGSHGTTFGGHPVSCAAALAEVNELLDRNLADNAKHGCFDRKLLITAIGSHIIRMVPPLILTEADCDKAYEIIRETVESLSTK